MGMHLHDRWVTVRLLLIAFALHPVATNAIELEDPDNFEVAKVWSGTDIGVPGRLGAMMFSEDGNTLYVVGNSEAANSALYAVAVARESGTSRVTNLGPAESTTLVFSGTLTGLDTGLEIGPEGTLFYTYWNANHLAQRPGGFAGEQTVYNMADVGVPSSIAGLTFSPHFDDSGSGFGQMQVSSWQGDNIYNVPLTPASGGLFDPGTAVLFAKLPQQGTGAVQYVPSGKLAGHLMYVNWDYGEVRVLKIDAATGLPIDADSGEPTLGTENPVDERFAYDMGVGPWGLEFDAQSRDFFVSTWDGTPTNSIIQFSGAGFTSEPDGGAGGGDGGIADGGNASDGSADGGSADGGSDGDNGGGCDCRIDKSPAGAGPALLLVFCALCMMRRRRGRPRHVGCLHRPQAAPQQHTQLSA